MDKRLKIVIDRLRLTNHRNWYRKRDNWMINNLQLPHLSSDEVKMVNAAWPFLPVTEKDLIWHRAYKKKYGFDPFFISDYHLEMILRKTNSHEQVISLENKAMYDVYFPGIVFPKTIIKCINGLLWAEGEIIGKSGFVGTNYLIHKNVDKFVIKPTLVTGGGKGVKLIDISELKDKRASLTWLLDSYGRNFIIQEVLKQHPDIEYLNPNSVNSCRVTTIFLDGRFSYSAIVKFGKNGSNIDNWHSGYLVGVNEDGTLKDTAYDSSMRETHKTDSGVQLDGIKLPLFKQMICDLHNWHVRYFPQIGICGWDVIIDNENKTRVIEMNIASPGVVGEQFCSGTFFKEQRDSIVSLFNV